MGSSVLRGCKNSTEGTEWPPPIPCHLLDEVEAPVQRGVHLPASGQPWKDTAEAVVSFPRPHLHKRGASGPAPTSDGFWRLQGVLLQKGALQTPPGNTSPTPLQGLRSLVHPHEMRHRLAPHLKSPPKTHPCSPSCSGGSKVFLELFMTCPKRGQGARRGSRGLSLTGAGEVPALDGVTRAGVHPARGLGLVAVKDKVGGSEHPGGLREGSLAGWGLGNTRKFFFQPKERKRADFRETGERHPPGSSEPREGRNGEQAEMTTSDRKAPGHRALQRAGPLAPSLD